jgi:hypothetical protein
VPQPWWAGLLRASPTIPAFPDWLHVTAEVGPGNRNTVPGSRTTGPGRHNVEAEYEVVFTDPTSKEEDAAIKVHE